MLISGGNETTEKLIANTVHQLSRHPDQREALLRDPRRISNAIEEIHTRLPDYEVEESCATVVQAGNVSGLAILPIRFTPGAQTRS